MPTATSHIWFISLKTTSIFVNPAKVGTNQLEGLNRNTKSTGVCLSKIHSWYLCNPGVCSHGPTRHSTTVRSTSCFCSVTAHSWPLRKKRGKVVRACIYVPINTHQHVSFMCVFVLQSDLTQDISTSVLWVDNKPHMITLDYTIQVPKARLQNLPEVR